MGGYGSSYDYSTDRSVTSRSASSYNIDSGRRYQESSEGIPPPRGKVLSTRARFPMVVAVDVTGSMSEYPKIIFEKLCVLYNEVMYFLPEDLKENFEISFCAIGDANSDKKPVQIADFSKGSQLDLNLKSFYPEGGGGGQARETYELIAYYYARKCSIPNVVTDPKPLFVFIGDEGYYTKINRAFIKDLVGDDHPADLESDDIFHELMEKFTVYHLRVKYSDYDDELTIHNQWAGLLGKDRVLLMKDPRRVVDVIIGIVSTAVNEFEKFKERIEVRQTPEQVEEVFDALDGVKVEGKRTYVRSFSSCPECGTSIVHVPGSPSRCKECGTLIIKM